jgi:hypothetical protein
VIGQAGASIFNEWFSNYWLVPVRRWEQVGDARARRALLLQLHLHPHVVVVDRGMQVREHLHALVAEVHGGSEVTVVAGEVGFVA